MRATGGILTRLLVLDFFKNPVRICKIITLRLVSAVDFVLLVFF
jgi:hypothetical protein